jgi:hypothetical protein
MLSPSCALLKRKRKGPSPLQEGAILLAGRKGKEELYIHSNEYYLPPLTLYNPIPTHGDLILPPEHLKEDLHPLCSFLSKASITGSEIAGSRSPNCTSATT